LKISITKRVGGMAQGEDPEFKPQYCRKKKKKHWGQALEGGRASWVSMVKDVFLGGDTAFIHPQGGL
jgi:hypothetical protein